MYRSLALLAVVGSCTAFNAPAPTCSPARVSSVAMGLESMPGGYALGGTFDPLGIAEKSDVIWMREAELKHGRVAMLATVGYIATDLGFKFPGEQYQGITSLAAHDAMVKTGNMGLLLAVTVCCEILHSIVIFPQASRGWDPDYVPGNFELDPLKMANDRQRTAELKNGRLAMLAISGILTQNVLQNCGVTEPGKLCGEFSKGFPYM